MAADNNHDHDVHGRLSRAETIIERIDSTLSELTPEFRELNHNMAALLQQGSVIKDHEDRLRVLESDSQRAKGVIGLIHWIGFPTAAMTIVAVGYLFITG